MSLSAEQLQAQAIYKEQKHIATNHYNQTHLNFDNYMSQPSARAAKSRTVNPGRADNINQGREIDNTTSVAFQTR